FFQAEDGRRDRNVTGVQTCALPISYEHKSIMKNNGAHVHDGEIFTDQGILLETHDVKEIAHTVIREGRPKVIVVDDDPINLRVMEVVLHNEQYDVTTALSGVEVMQILEQDGYD